jgi:hypothetical protein
MGSGKLLIGPGVKVADTETAITTADVGRAPSDGNPQAIPSAVEAMANDYKPFADDTPDPNHNDPPHAHPESNWGLLRCGSSRNFHNVNDATWDALKDPSVRKSRVWSYIEGEVYRATSCWMEGGFYRVTAISEDCLTAWQGSGYTQLGIDEIHGFMLLMVSCPRISVPETAHWTTIVIPNFGRTRRSSAYVRLAFGTAGQSHHMYRITNGKPKGSGIGVPWNIPSSLRGVPNMTILDGPFPVCLAGHQLTGSTLKPWQGVISRIWDEFADVYGADEIALLHTGTGRFGSPSRWTNGFTTAEVVIWYPLWFVIPCGARWIQTFIHAAPGSLVRAVDNGLASVAITEEQTRLLLASEPFMLEAVAVRAAILELTV